MPSKRSVFAIFAFLFVMICLPGHAADAGDPIKVTASWKGMNDTEIQTELGFQVEERGFRVYKESIKISAEGMTVIETGLPKGQTKTDPFSQTEKEIYAENVTWITRFAPAGTTTLKSIHELTVSVTYRACNNMTCHVPRTKTLRINPRRGVIRADFSEILASLLKFIPHVENDRVEEFANNYLWVALCLCFFLGALAGLTLSAERGVEPLTLGLAYGAEATPPQDANAKEPAEPSRFHKTVTYCVGFCLAGTFAGALCGALGMTAAQSIPARHQFALFALLFGALAALQSSGRPKRLPEAWKAKFVFSPGPWSAAKSFANGTLSPLLLGNRFFPAFVAILILAFDSTEFTLGAKFGLAFSMGTLGVLLIRSRFPTKKGTAFPLKDGVPAIRRSFAVLFFIGLLGYGMLSLQQFGILPHEESFDGQSGIHWLSNEQEAIRIAREKNLPLLIDFTAEWCGACHELEETVYQDPRVIKKMEQFVPLRIDVTAETPENEEKLRKYGVMALPAIVFIDRSGRLLEEPRILGAVPPDYFLDALAAF